MNIGLDSTPGPVKTRQALIEGAPNNRFGGFENG
jgi:hypothetical protein